MLQVKVVEDHVAEYDQWYYLHPDIFRSEVIAIRDQLLKLGPNIHGIEVGLGTGLFSEILGIKEGIEPSKSMRDKAIKRGIEVINARAEHLPYKSLRKDFVLFVTICHLNNVKEAFKEAYRVLKPGGHIIVGFLTSKGKVAKHYLERKAESTFYRKAQFYTVEEIEKYLRDLAFCNFQYNQTLFGELGVIEDLQYPEEGNDKGSFIVVKATKK